MIKEFKEFIARGNVLDLAIGLVMGSAFTAIVNSLVGDILTPLIVSLTGQAKVENLSVMIGNTPIQYGLFLQAVVNFFLIALSIFFMIKFINTLTRKNKPEPEETPVEAPTVEDYLEEIRDLLAKKDVE